jgi:hypothetical protein
VEVKNYVRGRRRKDEFTHPAMQAVLNSSYFQVRVEDFRRKYPKTSPRTKPPEDSEGLAPHCIK